MNNIAIAGEKFKVIRDNTELKEVMGLMHYNGTSKEFIAFQPDEEILQGDIVVQLITGKEFKISKTEPHISFGQIDQIKAFYS
jgi:hypothetical protein